MSDSTATKPPMEVIKRLSQLPTMKIKAGPRDGDLWLQRLEEEYKCLIMVRSNTLRNLRMKLNGEKPLFKRLI